MIKIPASLLGTIIYASFLTLLIIGILLSALITTKSQLHESQKRAQRVLRDSLHVQSKLETNNESNIDSNNDNNDDINDGDIDEQQIKNLSFPYSFGIKIYQPINEGYMNQYLLKKDKGNNIKNNEYRIKNKFNNDINRIEIKYKKLTFPNHKALQIQLLSEMQNYKIKSKNKKSLKKRSKYYKNVIKSKTFKKKPNKRSESNKITTKKVVNRLRRKWESSRRKTVSNKKDLKKNNKSKIKLKISNNNNNDNNDEKYNIANTNLDSIAESVVLDDDELKDDINIDNGIDWDIIPLANESIEREIVNWNWRELNKNKIKGFKPIDANVKLNEYKEAQQKLENEIKLKKMETVDNVYDITIDALMDDEKFMPKLSSNESEMKYDNYSGSTSTGLIQQTSSSQTRKEAFQHLPGLQEVIQLQSVSSQDIVPVGSPKSPKAIMEYVQRIYIYTVLFL